VTYKDLHELAMGVSNSALGRREKLTEIVNRLGPVYGHECRKLIARISVGISLLESHAAILLRLSRDIPVDDSFWTQTLSDSEMAIGPASTILDQAKLDELIDLLSQCADNRLDVNT